MDNQLLEQAYRFFNERNLDAVLDLMHPKVSWPNVMKGVYLEGREAVREYWVHQWTTVNPEVTPLRITNRPDGKIEVFVQQVVKDLDGDLLLDTNIKHVYSMRDGLIESMIIEA